MSLFSVEFWKKINTINNTLLVKRAATRTCARHALSCSALVWSILVFWIRVRIRSAVGWLFADWALVDSLAVLFWHVLAGLLGDVAALLARH